MKLTHLVGAYFQQKEFERLQALAIMNDVTMSYLIRQAVSEYLKKTEEQNNGTKQKYQSTNGLC